MPEKEKYNYYKGELERLDMKEYLSIQIRGESGATKWMGLNKESIPELIVFLMCLNKEATEKILMDLLNEIMEKLKDRLETPDE